MLKGLLKHIANVNANAIENVNETKEGNNNGVTIVEKFPFDDFWNIYDKKVDRKNCESKWNKYSEETKEKIMLHIPSYVSSTPDKSFRKNPETYLNQEAWNNEIINHAKQSSQSQQKTGNTHNYMRSPQQDEQKPKIYKFDA